MSTARRGRGDSSLILAGKQENFRERERENGLEVAVRNLEYTYSIFRPKNLRGMRETAAST